MLKLYFLTAFRSLLRNKSYSLLNVSGLALGITCSILLFLIIKYELSYDTFHSKAERIYRVNSDMSYEGDITRNTGIRFPVAGLLRANGKLGMENMVQVYAEDGAQINVLSENGNVKKRFLEEESVGFVEPGFFDLFDFETGSADPRGALGEPNTVVLTQSAADKYFPEGNAVGKLLRYNNLLTLKVSAVIPDFPSNTDFPFTMLLSYESYKNYTTLDISTFDNLTSNHQLYVLLPEGVSPQAKETEISNFINQNRKQHPRIKETFSLQPLSDLHFNSDYGNYGQRTISREIIWSMALIGIFLVLVACINFVNLATAQVVKRAREVGVRKVMGSSKRQLILQFMGETLLITLLASFLSVILVELTVPYLNELLELNITFSMLQDPILLLFLVAQVVLVTLLAGLYPALIMARFQPIEALKSRINTQRVAGLSLRRALVVLQFTICQVLIICTILVNAQMDFFRNKSLGFNKEAVVTVQLPSQAGQKIMPLRAEMLRNPAIRNVSFAVAPPSANMTWASSFSYNNSSQTLPFSANMKFADENYLDLFGIDLVAGRAYKNSDSTSVLVNETMLQKLGVKTPAEVLGKSIALNGGTLKTSIVGVVEDFHQNSLHQPIDPTIMIVKPNTYSFLSAKIDMSQKQEALQHLEKVWSMVYPDDVFSYEFLDETIANFYQDEARQNTLFKVFSFIAILIGCLGLYGLIAFMAAQRTKEVGIRKVMGASVFNIALLFSKEFVKLVLIAFVLAAPIAYYIISLWLQDFTYRIDINFWPFVLAGTVTLLIALITMSSKAIQAAMANPVLSLKTE
ncbi:ABC-type lipoprotein release transport system permease subunit [Pontibacter ummariensis]|uniref:ABC-type transport system, involved in lipoprotein release, permease component n=1 Tax=Pontibacter ummariensis TaxID=1610492 RepID=A0A239C725_9BACT|nr:ABC transporter permease [Pontibacter ummariensis]PRY15421.1 ABC-type lipoprotein release transport system permease subunit [Pontibacter ummariensis]SNS15739.1 ABC-type transport system, involved in lipoprotein release, permease component [Pontibacter ummariensis]